MLKHFMFSAFFLLICTVSQAGNFLVLGDSHGAMDIGWVNQLKKLRPNDHFCNLSISGNTIGFKNNDRDTLNTLRNIKSYIRRGNDQLGKIDVILVLLGTNDCKAVFDGKTNESISNWNRLLEEIRAVFPENSQTHILLVSPPPAADDSVLTEKYKGMNGRLKMLVPRMGKTAKEKDILFLNIFKFMYPYRNKLTSDGVHYTVKGYQEIALQINRIIQKNFSHE
ncbi:MAG: lipolytic protein family [Bacteroidetes bacterium]|nr:lipolytic protein family [Bacteroidota bacterium]